MFRDIAALLLAAGSLAMWGQALEAQNANTVRDNEFRSRWADYQVDRTQTSPDSSDGSVSQEQAGLLSAFTKTFSDYFRDGPLQTRADLGLGYEYSNEAALTTLPIHYTDNSAFVSPALGLFYNHEIGPTTVSARYSVGYVYYLDPKYVAANNGAGILSQTGGLDVRLEGSRVTFSSSSTGSYGNGEDIESGVNRELLSLGETASASYVLSTFTELGVAGGGTYSDYAGGGVADTDTLDDTISVYLRYAYSPKTQARFEIATGQEFQRSSGSGSVAGSADRSYYQALISLDYLPGDKLTMSLGLGYGVQNDSSVVGRGSSGSHPIYRITIQYSPTQKTTASLRFGYEGVDVEPSLNIEVRWQFRLTTSASLSVYQSSDFSTYEIDQSLVTRGVLISAEQRLFSRVQLSASAGVEESVGYGSLVGAQNTASEKPYYFAGASLLWEINSYLAIQTYYRGFTGESGAVTNQNGLQSRAAVSLRLTF